MVAAGGGESRLRVVAGLGAVGIASALLGAPGAVAEPVPSDPVAPVEVVQLPAEAADPTLIAAPEAVSLTPEAVSLTPEAVSLTPEAVQQGLEVPPDGVPHLPSPENLPPGTTQTRAEGRTMGYLRDLWHAIQTQDVTGADALLLFTQRPMDARAAPPPGVPTTPLGPQSALTGVPVPIEATGATDPVGAGGDVPLVATDPLLAGPVTEVPAAAQTP